MFLCVKIHNQELICDYYEPRWDWIKNFLTEDKIDDFVCCNELWGDLPNKFLTFKDKLKEKILELDKQFIIN